MCLLQCCCMPLAERPLETTRPGDRNKKIWNQMFCRERPPRVTIYSGKKKSNGYEILGELPKKISGNIRTRFAQESELVWISLKLQKSKLLERELRIEEVHPGSNRTYRSESVARDQVPRHKSNFSSRGLSVAFTNTDLKPLNNNLQCIKIQFCGVISYKVS